MSRRLSHYPRALRLRALAAAVSLSISAAAFVVLSSLAAVERHEKLCRLLLRCRIKNGAGKTAPL